MNAQPRRWLAVLVSAVVAISVVAATAPAAFAATTKTYTESSAIIANPERGWFHQLETHYTGDGSSWTPLTSSQIQGYRSAGITVIRRVFYLEAFQNADLSTDVLSKIRADFETAREAHLTLIPRFAYSDTSGADATPAQVLRHIDQLAPIFSDYQSNTFLVEAGFIGRWGEGYYTDHFGDQNNITDANWADRNAVVNRLLHDVPQYRSVVVRYPLLKQKLVNRGTGAANAVNSGEAYQNTPLARVGFHNDCFGLSDNEGGTWKSNPISDDQDYLAAETKYVPMEGETCDPYGSYTGPSQSQALSELAQYHYSSLNTDFSGQVLSTWDAATKTTIAQKLGYRIVLDSSSVSGSSLSVTLHNAGWAAPVNARYAKLILVGASGSHTYDFSNSDVRTWAAGTSTTITADFAGVPSGTYSAYLSIPSSDSFVAADPAYAIQTANVGTWDASTGYNNLEQSITVP